MISELTFSNAHKYNQVPIMTGVMKHQLVTVAVFFQSPWVAHTALFRVPHAPLKLIPKSDCKYYNVIKLVFPCLLYTPHKCHD